MPPYRRDIAASSACAASCSRSSGKKCPSTVAAAPEKPACPDTYDGKLGSPIGVVIAGSACDGRMSQYAYFASQMAMPVSIIAVFTTASTWAASPSDRLYQVASSAAVRFQCPGGVYVPAPSPQCFTMSSSRVVRASE